ncbi:hypothetical protein [Haloferax sp. ATCC BAA-646]|uniref:hypothetical protein n=2 Tax=Haloferax TaxID=2251 RepID=UPI0002B0AFC3|nr:hypothetical protein [Haloferax sp. ATCC BAA-646]ELZ58193.1 hypothetical protein C460_10423 [Haloferax sp. ATCC BAA-646]ELZ62978.1 hypothetical protein C459_11800 [Haloferax sp. ATCC BAA-645]ELZ63649.1 hypothetical protein C458_15871 [Haloferax sp. ATCC BAA-644]
MMDSGDDSVVVDVVVSVSEDAPDSVVVVVASELSSPPVHPLSAVNPATPVIPAVLMNSRLLAIELVL